MKALVDSNRHTIILARGEELIATLTKYCEESGIASAFFQGIGAVERVEIGYYDLAKKEYYFRSDDAVFEVAAMQGNVALIEEPKTGETGSAKKPFIHAHAVLSRCDETLACIGAHIKSAHVAVTLEISMTVGEIPMERKLNDDIGLKLINL